MTFKNVRSGLSGFICIETGWLGLIHVVFALAYIGIGSQILLLKGRARVAPLYFFEGVCENRSRAR